MLSHVNPTFRMQFCIVVSLVETRRAFPAVPLEWAAVLQSNGGDLRPDACFPATACIMHVKRRASHVSQCQQVQLQDEQPVYI